MQMFGLLWWFEFWRAMSPTSGYYRITAGSYFQTFDNRWISPCHIEIPINPPLYIITPPLSAPLKSAFVPPFSKGDVDSLWKICELMWLLHSVLVCFLFRIGAPSPATEADSTLASSRHRSRRPKRNFRILGLLTKELHRMRRAFRLEQLFKDVISRLCHYKANGM